MSATALDRFWTYVEPEPMSGCWLWAGAWAPGDYGVLWIGHDEGLRRAHRFSYETFRGPIPDGLEPDHLCRVRSCVNPWHLELVTRRENFLRGNHPTAVRFRAGVCPYGHSMADAYKDKRGGRMCRTCALDRYHRIGRDQRRARLARSAP